MKITEEKLKELGFQKKLNPYNGELEWFIGTEMDDLGYTKSIISYNQTLSTARCIRGEFQIIIRDDITDVWELKEFVKCIQFLYPDISDEIQLNQPEPYYTLQKDLPHCPKGRIFKQTVDKEWYYHSMSDEENMSGDYMRYEFSSLFVENNPEWFSKNKPN